MSQAKMAERLGVSYDTYKKWECANSYPDADMFLEIAKQYDCDIDFIFGLQSLPRKEITDCTEYTGLSPCAVELLNHSLYSEHPYLSKLVSDLIESGDILKQIHNTQLTAELRGFADLENEFSKNLKSYEMDLWTLICNFCERMD